MKKLIITTLTVLVMILAMTTTVFSDECAHTNLDEYSRCTACGKGVCPNCRVAPKIQLGYYVTVASTCETEGLWSILCSSSSCVEPDFTYAQIKGIVPALGHLDENNDHYCDRCNASFCKDQSPADHKCDICKKELSQCLDENPADHKCDICKKKITDCSDSDPADHKCDICGVTVSECRDAAPPDYICDICGKEVTEHTTEGCTHIDINGYRICGNCKQTVCPNCNGTPGTYEVRTNPSCEEKGLMVMGCACQFTPVVWTIPALGHIDANNDHTCDRCSNAYCKDENPADHKCDICQKVLSACQDNNPADHKCDICQKVLSACHDSNPVDHECDICQNVLSECRDENPVDQKCDICSKEMPVQTPGECTHSVVNNYRICSNCKQPICPKCNGVPETYKIDSEPTCEKTGDIVMACVCQNTPTKLVYWTIPALGHIDANNDHACDRSGCQITVSECADANPKDHKCDICTKNMGVHEDNDKDHVCDYGCAVKIGTCADSDKNHFCDYGCGKNFGTHEDANKDHVCDYGCAVSIGTCEDKDKNHACDYGCASTIGVHKDDNKDHNCDYGCAVAIGEHKDDNKDHNCDYGCAVKIGTCSDADKNHFCDYGCGKNFGTHEDTNKDHNCDYGCSVKIGTCEDADKDHSCDYGCGNTFGTHEDTNKDHNCDYGCSVKIGTCEDADKDHSCDYGCDKNFGTHEDVNKDHNCDYGCGVTIGDHTGGEATCTSKATCDYCGNEYGEVDSSNHNIEKIPAKDATVTETGNKEYWHCKDCDKFFSDKDGKNSIALKDTVIDKLPLKMIEGTNQSITAGETKELTFRSNADFSDFIRVELDGKTLDAKYYTAREGSTIITLKADYAASLSTGNHTIGIVSTSGTATTEFSVNVQTVSGNDSPKTGDNSNLLLWLALLFVSGGMMTVTGGYKKREKHS